MWFTVLLIGLIIFLVYRIIKFWILDPWSIHRDFWKQGIPGQYTPIVGEIFGRRRALLSDDPYLHDRKLAEKYGAYFHNSFGPKACLNTNDPSLIECILKTNARCYHKSALAQAILAALLGYENVLLAEDENHTRHRRLIAPVFQHQNINSMISLMTDRTYSFLEKWTTAAENKTEPLNLDIHVEMTNLTLDIVTSCVFGTDIINDKHVHETISHNVEIAVKEIENRVLNMIAIVPILNILPLPSKLRIDKCKNEIKEAIQQIINKRKKGLTKSACKGPDLLDLILMASGDEKTQKFTNEEVTDEAITFILAGHETTSTLMTWTLYNLTTNPDVYRQCQAEIDSVLNDTNNEITSSTLSLLTYTEAVLKETLRFHQPVPLLLRTAVEDNTIVARDGKQIRIKKGTDIVINFLVLHHSEKYWHEPNQFDPTRFNGRYSDILLPFGAGPRSCIGQNFAMLESKIMLAILLKRFHFELIPGQKLVPDTTVTIRPRYGLWMRVSPR